jgi:hypothetical protein
MDNPDTPVTIPTIFSFFTPEFQEEKGGMGEPFFQ